MTNPVSGSHTNEGAFVLIVLFFRPHSATKQKNLSIYRVVKKMEKKSL